MGPEGGGCVVMCLLWPVSVTDLTHAPITNITLCEFVIVSCVCGTRVCRRRSQQGYRDHI